MLEFDNIPRIFHILEDEAIQIHHTVFGSVGDLYHGGGIEAVWVKKQAEEIDLNWFSQPVVDLILVVKGNLKVDYERGDLESCMLQPGDLLVLPANTRCRAYRWPRDAAEATIFLAVYPIK